MVSPPLVYQKIDDMLPEGQPSKIFDFFSCHGHAVNRKTRIEIWCLGYKQGT
jgi:hypothetical protein